LAPFEISGSAKPTLVEVGWQKGLLQPANSSRRRIPEPGRAGFFRFKGRLQVRSPPIHIPLLEFQQLMSAAICCSCPLFSDVANEMDLYLEPQIRAKGEMRMGKASYTDKNGKQQEQTFKTEAEGQALKAKLKAEGATNIKFEW